MAASEKSSIQNFTRRALVNVDHLAGSVGCSEVSAEIPARLDHLPLARFHGKAPMLRSEAALTVPLVNSTA
jgi:hypothetical protein